MNQWQVFISKAVVPKVNQIAESDFINLVIAIRASESIYNKARDNKIGTRSVLKPAQILKNPLTMAQKPLFI